jgi:hypothetical protein
MSERIRTVRQECHVVPPHGTAAIRGSPPGSLASLADNDLLICRNGGNVMKVSVFHFLTFITAHRESSLICTIKYFNVATMQIHMQVLRVRISQYTASILFITAKETEAII